MRLQPRGCEIPASEGRRQANHPHFQIGEQGVFVHPKIKAWPFASFQALRCHFGGGQAMGYRAMVVQRDQLQDCYLQRGQ